MAASRSSDPRRLDVAAFAAAGVELAGEWPLAGFSRLATATLPATAEAPGVTWRFVGGRATLSGAGLQPTLHVGASSEVTLECQRCLQPLHWPLTIERRLFFVEGEDAAAALDAESDDDVLALSPVIDVHALVEDELLLALPIVPRHEVCEVPLGAAPEGGSAAAGVAESEAEREAQRAAEHPFAALAALKRRQRPN